jgi:predicted amidohydrolase YtcJ
MQPGYAWIDKRFLHSYERFLPEKARSSLRFGSLYRAGVCVCGSSDAPVQSIDPWLQMQGMCEFYHEEESVTPFEAFRCYTIHPARAMEEEENIGTLEVSKEANFFVADEDLFRIDPHKVAEFRPRATYYGGKAFKKRSGSIGELIAMFLRKPHKV